MTPMTAQGWTDKSVDIVFKMFMKEFNAAALQWTKGTGGGDGALLNYVIWQTRNPLAICTYGKQNAQLYITPVYMFDNEYGLIIVEPKEMLPLGC